MKTAVAAAIAVAPIALAQPQVHPNPWPVHDPDRPLPPRVENAAAVTIPPPSDAVVLFDANDLDAWQKPDGSAAPWTARGAVLEVAPGTGPILTRDRFADVQLHIEWRSPESAADKEGQARANSGVFFMERYEVQILESVGSTTYADGMAASLYGQRPPLVNPGAGIGRWQSYDIIFHAPRFDDDGDLLAPATATILHNGVLVQDDVAFEGPTRHRQRTSYEAHEPTGRIMLQDHGDPIQFRNIWIRRLEDKAVADAGWEDLFPAGGLGTAFDFITRADLPEALAQFDVTAGEIRILADWPHDEAPFGYLVTRAPFSSYDLELDYRWGDKRYAPRADEPRDSGILLHVRDVTDVWPRCIEYQVKEGDTGTCYKIGKSEATAVRNGKPVDPDADPTARALRWEDHETDAWNHCRVEVRGDSARFYLNGHLVNELTDFKADGSTLDSGRIGIQIEAAELTIRNARIRPAP